MIRDIRSCFIALGISLLLILPAIVRADWPERPVTIVVPAGAGGGTDQTARMLATRLKQKFGQPFNVVNQGQGSGVVGISNIANARPDGYTLGILYNFAHYKPMGQGDFSVKNFSAIAQYNFDPAGFHVTKSSEWTSLPQALDAIKANPSTYSIACGGGCGGSWPVAVVSLFDAWGVDLKKLKMIPGRGAAAALQDLAAGGLDVVPSSLPEARPLLAAGYIRGLGVFSGERLAAFPDIPTLHETTGLNLHLGAWRGLVGPAALPHDIRCKLESALQEIVASTSWREEMSSLGFGIKWRGSSDFRMYMLQQQAEVRELLEDLDL